MKAGIVEDDDSVSHSRPKKGSRGSVNGREYIVVGFRSVVACSFGQRSKNDWTVSSRRDHLIPSEYLDYCSLDEATRELQRRVCQMKEGDALINTVSTCTTCMAGGPGQVQIWECIKLNGTVIKWVEQTDE